MNEEQHIEVVLRWKEFEKKIKGVTINRELKTLQSILNRGIELDLLPTKSKLKIKKYPETPVQEFIEKWDHDMILDHAPDYL